MYKPIFNKRSVLKFKHFCNRPYSLFAVIGKEVIIGVLSVATLQSASAHGISIRTDLVGDSTASHFGGTLQEVNVTGTRAPLTASQQARMVTVLTRDDIQSAPVQSVNDLLKYAAAVDVRQKGPQGILTDVSIRGGNSEQITLLLNGINICDPQTGHNAFDLPVDLSDIERIEVLEGPAGRAYGTSSLLGAINIVTRKPADESITAHAEAGSYGYLSAGLRASAAGRHNGHSLSAGAARSDGYLRNKAGSLSADYNTVKAFYQGFYSDNDMRISWHAGISNKNYGSNTFYGTKYDDQFEHTFKSYTALQGENTRGRLHFRPAIYWNHQYDRFELFRGHPEKYPFNYHRTDIFGVNINGYFDWLLGRTAFGAELRNEDLISGNLGEPLSKPHHISGTDRFYDHGLNRTNIQLVLEHNVILSRFTLSAGIIAVKNSQADMSMRVYPGIDMSYRIGSNWKVFASYNSSLRMPSFTELYYSVGGHRADSRLQPEELSALEGGVRFVSDAVSAKASVFYNHHRNLIDWISDGTTDEDGATLWQSVNFGHINTLGIEASLHLNLKRIIASQQVLRSLNIAWCYMNQDQAEDEGIVSKYALEYLKNKLTASLDMRLWDGSHSSVAGSRKSLDLSLRYRLQHRMGEYFDIEGSKHSYATYGIADARLALNMPKWEVFAEANNLFGCHYIDYGNIAQPGFTFSVGAAVRIGK